MTNPAAKTMFGPLIAVAIEQSYPPEQRLVQDEWAYRFLPPANQWLARLAGWPPAQKLLFSILERRARGVWGGVLCRKRYIAEQACQAMQAGMKSVVILGAGLDTTACRLGARGAARFFEVDLPDNIAFKRMKLEQLYGSVPGQVCLAPVDFNEQDPGPALAAQGFRVEERSFFICEAVTQYLSEAGIRNLFEFLSRAGAGSRLVFTYITSDFLDGKAIFGAEALYRRYREKGQLWRFGLEPGRVAGFLQAYGWQEREQLGSWEYTGRYVKPAGRSLPVMEFERAVGAEKLA